MSILSSVVEHSADVYARQAAAFAQRSSTSLPSPIRAEEIALLVAHASSPLHAELHSMGAKDMGEDCMVLVVDASAYGIEFMPGHIGVVVAIGNDITNRVIAVDAGAVS